MFWQVLALFTVLCEYCSALRNVTVDDSGFDPLTGAVISYSTQWDYGPTCPKCLARPNPADAHNNSWHDATYLSGSSSPQTMSFEFAGSAVYVFGILAYTIKGPVGNSDLSFYVDGDLVGTFNFTPPGEDTYSYNTILYANDSLDHASHALTLQNGRAGVHESLILLDYIIYSTEESPLSGQQSSSQQSTLSIGTSLNPPTPFTSPVSQLTHALPSSSVQSPTTRAFPSAHTTTRTIVLSTLLPTLLLLPALILAFVCHRRRRRLQLALRPTALAYDSFLSPGCSSPSKSRSTIVAALHRTTQYARNSQGIWTRIRGESACGDEGTGVSAALGTVESTEPSTPASSQCTAVEDVRVRQKIYAEIDRSNRHAAERRAQRGERRSGIMSS